MYRHVPAQSHNCWLNCLDLNVAYTSLKLTKHHGKGRNDKSFFKYLSTVHHVKVKTNVTWRSSTISPWGSIKDITNVKNEQFINSNCWMRKNELWQGQWTAPLQHSRISVVLDTKWKKTRTCFFKCPQSLSKHSGLKGFGFAKWIQSQIQIS